ncbi:MAG: small ribosomal subunit Rsm22 family protein [Blastocatellia bacterium]|nr:small ribosomal subunit Rsm22 family protein [Blastocatellia bacterium]
MQLPPPLRNAVEDEAARHSLPLLIQAAADLSERYRNPQSPPERLMITEAHRAAYIATRMPATYAALHRVFGETARRVTPLSLHSLLDLGAGPGTAAWAAAEIFPELREITQIERDPALIRLGKSLVREGAREALRTAVWRQEELAQRTALPEADLVVCSYTLNELGPTAAKQVVRRAWTAARHALALVEPGTMSGFSLLRELRGELLALGARIVAPCPHQETCPMPEGDWCHFAARCERTALHRRLKAGALGYEDEKFSYLVAVTPPAEPAEARILRRPAAHPGFVKLELCTPDGLRKKTITRGDKAHWKQARKAEWGDAW